MIQAPLCVFGPADSNGCVPFRNPMVARLTALTNG